MIVYEVEQGTPEWNQCRAGVITASMFGEIMKRLKSGPNKGDFSAAAKDYAFRLAIERISGKSLDEGGFETFAMRRGHELEPLARSEHEVQTGLSVDRAGFISTEDNLFGASADGLIGDDGGSEYKCFIAPDKLRPILFDGDASDVEAQIQGCLWLTGRKWWHLGLYCPALECVGRQLTIIKRERDEAFITEMEQSLVQFNGLVEQIKARIINPEIAQ